MEKNQTKRALLLIDLQQDFVSPNGPFKRSQVNADHIISNLTAILPHFRAHNGVVVWIKYNYSELEIEPKHFVRPEGERFSTVPLNDDFHAGTHRKFPVCVPGTDGEKFIPAIDSLIERNQDIIVTKIYYSSFTDTNLAEILKDIKEVHICGLMTNVCVQATAADAFFHGHEVFVWTDCLGYLNETKHQEALSHMKRWYATMINSNNYLQGTQATTPKPVLYFVNGSTSSWRVMMALCEKGIDFEAKRLKVMCKSAETRTPEFLAINPRGLAPTFVDSDGSVIGESLAILHYLEEYYSNTVRLMPTEKAERIRVLQLIQESQNLMDIYEPLEEVAFKTSKQEQSCLKDSIVKTLEMIYGELAFWETYLTKTSFVACNQFTLADCAFYPVVGYLMHRGLDIDRYPALKNYVNKIKVKPETINAQPKGWKENGGHLNVFQVIRNIVAS